MLGMGHGDEQPKEQRKAYVRTLAISQLLAKSIFPLGK